MTFRQARGTVIAVRVTESIVNDENRTYSLLGIAVHLARDR